VYDLQRDSSQPIWERIGSYFTTWSLDDNNALVLSYDVAWKG